jgi:hypothetical protein
MKLGFVFSWKAGSYKKPSEVDKEGNGYCVTLFLGIIKHHQAESCVAIFRADVRTRNDSCVLLKKMSEVWLAED